MKLPNIKTPELILNNNVKCTIELYNGEVDIDGKIGVALKKTFDCYYELKNTTKLNFQSVETLSTGMVKINGNICSDNSNYSGGKITIKSKNINKTVNIISIEKLPNLLDCNIIDYTVIYVE